MSATFTTTYSVQTPAGTVSGSGSETADAVAFIDTTLAIGTDTEYDIDFKYAQVKSVIIKSAVACTVETNATDATGGNTITLVAGEPLQWRLGDAFANPFTADVTKVFITCAAAGAFQMYVLHDPTA